MKRDAFSPGGTHVGEQTLAHTPRKLHKAAWLFDIPAGATAGEAAELRKANGQSSRNARRKAKGEEISGEATLEPLSVRAERAGICQGKGETFDFGPKRRKAEKALSQQVLQAEQSVQERDAQNATKNDRQIGHRAEQSADVRDALNATRRANAQVTISVRLHCALHHTPHLYAWVLPTSHIPN